MMKKSIIIHNLEFLSKNREMEIQCCQMTKSNLEPEKGKIMKKFCKFLIQNIDLLQKIFQQILFAKKFPQKFKIFQNGHRSPNQEKLIILNEEL